ncbi:ATP12-domain-containing protein [Macrolepiota fuliginosa MF-IS2]|uniref:ATP12-domain-containing protein n=1 Tax=Macrolepiota fuliginosa MF-IS2 TaxID=1400762 RepID=A0A9P5XJZ0_9AGAR|nr:ATP12-domain-containing protein [Macrolepiota fuliginosa MF-IS2]
MLHLRRYVSPHIARHVETGTVYRYAWLNRTPAALRWQTTATATQDAPANEGPAVTETNRAEATMKRFWKDVGVDKRGDTLAVTLDKRTLKTPSGKPLLVPASKPLLATLIAAEWDHQKSLIKPHALPVTSLTSRAIDALADEPTCAKVREALLNYLDTDTICFYENTTPQIERLQAVHWDPLFGWFENTFGVKLNKHESILFSKQPQETRQKLGDFIKGFDQWQMAAMERATYTTKSFVIALALVLKHLTPEQAALAASVEVNSQIERWGEVEDTHDVDYHDIRRHLSSAASLCSSL